MPCGPSLSPLRPTPLPVALVLVLMLLSSILLVPSAASETKIAINAFALLRGAEYERCRCRCRVPASAAGAGAGSRARPLGYAEPLTCFDVGLTNTELQVCLHCFCFYSRSTPGHFSAKHCFSIWICSDLIFSSFSWVEQCTPRGCISALLLIYIVQ